MTTEVAAATAVAGSARPPRAVVLVANPAAPYSRSVRVARSLAGAGYEVEIAAVARDDLPNEEHDGEIVVRRYRPRGRWLRWSEWPSGQPGVARKVVFRLYGLASRLIPALRGHPVPTIDVIRRRLFWPIEPKAWGVALRRDLAPADLYHACGILTIRAALELGREARRQGRAGRVIYDVLDLSLDSNVYRATSRPVRAFYRWKERRWVHRAQAIVTVNDALADVLVERWGLRDRPTVLLNCPPRWDPPEPRPDLIRGATGLPATCRIVLFLGRLGKLRGLDEAAEAVLLVDDTALVLIGFGGWAERTAARDLDPRFAGRHFTLPAVPPDDVPAWTASADVSYVALPGSSLNQRLSTPNKFFESLTAGTPVVAGSELATVRSIVESERLGAVADAADPADIARALRDVLDRPEAERAGLRERCLEIARNRYNWEAAVRDYLALVATPGAMA